MLHQLFYLILEMWQHVHRVGKVTAVSKSFSQAAAILKDFETASDKKGDGC